MAISTAPKTKPRSEDAPDVLKECLAAIRQIAEKYGALMGEIDAGMNNRPLGSCGARVRVNVELILLPSKERAASMRQAGDMDADTPITQDARLVVEPRRFKGQW